MIATDHNSIVEGASEGEARSPQLFDVVEKAKSARPAQLRLECLSIESQTEFLAANQRVFEIYLETHREAVIGK